MSIASRSRDPQLTVIMDNMDLFDGHHLSQSHVFTSNRKWFRPCVDAQQPKDNNNFKIHLNSPSLAPGERRGLRNLTPTLRPTSDGRLRAKLPTAPKPLLEKRHTVRLQDRDERLRQ